MKPKSYILNISSKNIYIYVQINKISLAKVFDIEANTINKNISSYIINGDNTFSIDVFLPKIEDKTDISPLLNVELREVTPGNYENPKFLIQFELDPSQNQTREKRINVLNQTFSAQVPVENWSWQTAKPIGLQPGEVQSIKKFALHIQNLFKNKEVDTLIQLQDIKIAELSLATGQTKDEVIDDVKWLYQHIFSNDWNVLDLKEDDIKLTSEADGRLIYIGRTNNQMLIQSLPPAQKFSFELRVSQILVKGKKEWMIIR